MRLCRARELESLKGWSYSAKIALTMEFRTYLSAVFTHVRLLPRVNSFMNRQSRSLYELFVAARVFAYVRSYPSVDSFCKRISSSPARRVDYHHTVTCEIASPGKPFSTVAASKGLDLVRRFGLTGLAK